MNFKKTLVLLSLTPLLLSSCSNFGSHYLVKDLDSVLTSDLYQEFTIEDVNKAMGIDHEFIVYLASTGCSSCDAFSPDFDSFLKENHYLTYKFDEHFQPELKDEIILTYKEKFAHKDSMDNYYLSYPSIFIVRGNETEEIPYSKLKNPTMIANTFKGYVRSTNVYFTDGDAISKMVNNSKNLSFRDFGYLALDFNNASLLSYFKESLQSYINELPFPVIVTDFNEVEGSIAVKKGVITEDGLYGSKAETRSKDSSNLDYVKQVLNK